jgi:hypothetical protein
MTATERLKHALRNAFGLVNQQRGRTLMLIVYPFHETRYVARPPKQKSACRCPYLALEPLPARKHRMFPEALQARKKLVRYL